MVECDKTLCQHCAHMKVCSKKEMFLGLHKMVSNSSVCEIGEPIGASIKLRDLDWVRITLNCTHFLAIPINVRG